MREEIRKSASRYLSRWFTRIKSISINKNAAGTRHTQDYENLITVGDRNASTLSLSPAWIQLKVFV